MDHGCSGIWMKVGGHYKTSHVTMSLRRQVNTAEYSNISNKAQGKRQG